jgi:hypothetical protein
MIKKVMAYFLLVSFLNYIAGCRTFENENGGTNTTDPGVIDKYDLILARADTGMLCGKTYDGREIVLEPKHIQELRTDSPRFLCCDSLKERRISELLKVPSGLVRFDNFGGKYDPVSKTVSGYSPEGREIDLVHQPGFLYRVTRPDTISAYALYKNPKIKITEVLLRKSNGLVIFDSAGAVYVSSGSVSEILKSDKYLIQSGDPLTRLMQEPFWSVKKMVITVALLGASIYLIYYGLTHFRGGDGYWPRK